MENTKKDTCLKKQRETFQKQFKRLALIEFSKGKNANQVFKDLGIEINSKDKKYASKLIYKWRKEFYSNLRLFKISDSAFDENLLLQEMDYFISKKEHDDITEEYRNKKIKKINAKKIKSNK